jgi:hypothetical protein
MSVSKHSRQPKQVHRPTLRIELIGDDRAVCGAISVKGGFPVLKLCQQLMARGFDPNTALDCYRGEMKCLVVRSIGEGALLSVAGDGVGFTVRRHSLADMVTAPPVRNSEKSEPSYPVQISAPADL